MHDTIFCPRSCSRTKGSPSYAPVSSPTCLSSAHRPSQSSTLLAGSVRLTMSTSLAVTVAALLSTEVFSRLANEHLPSSPQPRPACRRVSGDPSILSPEAWGGFGVGWGLSDGKLPVGG